MPTLGDYVGSLLGEITRARAQADLETTRVAELYASHPLLRHFPVPRVRLPAISIDAPVIISEVEEDSGKCPEKPSLDCGKLITETEQFLVDELESYGIKPLKKDLEALRETLRKKFRRMERRLRPAAAIGSLAREFVRDLPPLVRKYRLAEQKLSDEDVKKIFDGAINVARQELLDLLPISPRVRVSPLTQDVKELGDTDRVVRLKLNIVEEGVEWAKIEEEGEERDVLLPE